MSRKTFALDAERRSFLKTVGLAGLSNGLLRASPLATGMMLGRNALAQNANGVNKIVCFFIGGGCPFQNGKSLFNPTANMEMQPCSMPLEPIKNDIVFFSDAEVSGGGGHGSTSKVFGGFAGDTIDVELAGTLGALSPFPQLMLGVYSNGSHGYATKKNHTEIPYQDNPIATFNRVFGAAGSGGNAGGGTSIGALRAQSVLDIQKAEIAQLRAKLGNEEKVRLDTHLNAIEKIEQRLSTMSNPGMGSGNPNVSKFNSGGFTYNQSDSDSFINISSLQMDLAVLALQSNQTRVVSIMLGNHQSEYRVPEWNWKEIYHQAIHGAGSLGPHIETRTFLTGRLKYLLDKLKSEKDEFGNPLLDSTLVLQIADMGDGNAHGGSNAPNTLSGGGSAVKGGQVVSCGPHANILDTATEILGMTGKIRKYGSGALTGIIA